MRKLFAIIFVTLISISAGRGQTVDWKFYGGADVGGESVCFYDANGVSRTGDQHVRVWTKCLPWSEVKKVDSDDLTKTGARKIEEGYVPPLVVIGVSKFDKVPEIVSIEEIADIAVIKPVSKILYELNCSEHMLRELSIDITDAGREGLSDAPRPWKYIAPESNGARLQQLLCTSEPLGR